MIGKTIAHYRVLHLLGRGGMGEVYLAQDTTLPRKVALKLLPEETQQDAVSRTRLLRPRLFRATICFDPVWSPVGDGTSATPFSGHAASLSVRTDKADSNLAGVYGTPI